MRLALGTAQFGLPYGIANQDGQVTRSVAKAMLRLAAAKGSCLRSYCCRYNQPTIMNKLPIDTMTSQRKSMPSNVRQELGRLLLGEPDIEFAVLVGSQADSTAQLHSDWDIALQWDAQLDWMAVLGKTETLRRKMAEAAGVALEKIDLIELRRANLAMRASVAEGGLPLKGEDTLAWAHFLTRTWRELEDFYWEKSHAA